jgi:hypothetical protein
MEQKPCNERVQIRAVEERHETLRTFFVGLFVTILISLAITGCTYYSVEKVQHPVKIEQNNSTSYERNN